MSLRDRHIFFRYWHGFGQKKLAKYLAKKYKWRNQGGWAGVIKRIETDKENPLIRDIEAICEVFEIRMSDFLQPDGFFMNPKARNRLIRDLGYPPQKSFNKAPSMKKYFS